MNQVSLKSAAKAFANFTDLATTGCFPYSTLCTGRDPPVFWRALLNVKVDQVSDKVFVKGACLLLPEEMHFFVDMLQAKA